MTALAAPPRALVPLAEWAASRGIAKSTAYRQANHGQLNGDDADHPLAMRDEQRGWLVAPWAVQPAPEEASADKSAMSAMRAVARAEVARAFSAVAAALQD